MIIVKLWGGLGNQMFQYAFGKNLSLIHKTALKLDLASYSHGLDLVTPRQYELHHFKIDEQFAEKEEINLFLKKRVTLLQKVRKRLRLNYCLPFISESNQFNSDVSMRKLKQCPSAYFEGYWQSEGFFIEHKEEIVRIFTSGTQHSAASLSIAESMSQKMSVSLHIRRGDYVANPVVNAKHGVLPLEYYQNAIGYLSERLKKIHLFIFSDEIEWVKDKLTINFPSSYVSLEKAPPHEELMLMSKCKHHIIANSSYSWWGAYLNNSPNKIVIGPKKWFGTASENSSNIMPSSWIQK